MRPVTPYYRYASRHWVALVTGYNGVARPFYTASPRHRLLSTSEFTFNPARHPSNQQRQHAEASTTSRIFSTPLAKIIHDAISTTGPVPLASFMRMCLTADKGSYYAGTANSDPDQFGVHGDFVTSPEISQIFGELVGIWFIAEWMSQGRSKQGVELIEVGPGRGTLMDDMLRTIQNFPDLARAIDAIYMVEASPRLREIQKNRLCGADASMIESKVGYHSFCKYTNVPIVWTETIKSIPIDHQKMPFIVAHEFFDALPIHAFQSVEIPPMTRIKSGTSERPAQPNFEWRELLVSTTSPTLSQNTTIINNNTADASTRPEFQLMLSQTPTRHSRYLPDFSPRYRKLKSTPSALIEICPDGWLHASDFAIRIGGSITHPKPVPSGAALIIDYGTPDAVPINSLRGIRRHRCVSPFSLPGMVDLSIDVDFASLAEASTRASEGVEIHGPIFQADFLESMGIYQRAQALSSQIREHGNDADALSIMTACKRLINRGPGGMGKIYHALAIIPENSGRRRPVGFGGDL